MAPTYLRGLIECYQQIVSQTLCLATQLLLKAPKTRLKSYRDFIFSKAAPVLWNAQPLIIKACDRLDTFKSACKTYRFNADES